MSVLLSSSDWEDSLGVFQSLTFQFLPNECLPFLVSSYTYFHAGTKFLALKISAINVQGCRNDDDDDELMLNVLRCHETY